MGALEEVGVALVAKNASLFQTAMTAAIGVMNQSGSTAESAAKRSKVMEVAYDGIAKAAKIAATAIEGANKQTGDSVNRLTSRFQAVRSEIASALQPITGALGTVGGAVSDLVQKTVGGFGSIGTAVMNVVPIIGNVFSSVFTAISSVVGAAIQLIGVGFVGALGLVAGALGGLFALAKRAAGFEDLISSFQNLTASAGLSARALLSDMREAVRGLIPDMELLQRTTLALTGLQGEFAQQMGQAMPKLLEIARAASKATGQEFNYLFESIITGLRRGSPLILDNLGLVISITEANQRYAESIGKAADQLTTWEQKQALLQAVLLEGQGIIDAAGADIDTLGDKLTRASTYVTNALDIVGLALQTPFKDLLDIVNTALGSVVDVIQQSAVYIAAVGDIIADAIRPIFTTIDIAAEQLNSPEAARAFAMGAAATFGSFARGVALAGVHILNTVAVIAQGIADFLLGNSPPPKGPLSRMAEGAAATMQAWLAGFVGVPLDPVKQVAQQVKDALGSIAGASLAQVESRLAQLDRALLPFQQRLSIVKSDFDAIAKIGEIAFRAIDRQLDKAVEMLTQGIEGSGALVRSLDTQRDSIQALLDARQQENEQYELQLAMAQAMQARERALLEIRKSQIPVITATTKAAQKATKAAGGGTEEKPKKEPKPTGGGATIEPPVAGVTPVPLEDLFNFSDMDIAAARADIDTAFQGAFGDVSDQMGAARFHLGLAASNLKAGLGNLPARLQEMFTIPPGTTDNIVATLGDTLGDILRRAVERAVNGDGEGEGGMAGSDLGSRILASIGESLSHASTPVDFGAQLGEDFRRRLAEWVHTNIEVPLQDTVDNITISLANIKITLIPYVAPDPNQPTGTTGAPLNGDDMAGPGAGVDATGAGKRQPKPMLQQVTDGLSGSTDIQATLEQWIQANVLAPLTDLVNSKIATALSGLRDMLLSKLTAPFTDAVSAIANQLDVVGPMSPSKQLMALTESWIPFALTNLRLNLYNYLVLPFNEATNQITGIVSGPLGIGSTLAGIALMMPTYLATLPDALQTSLRAPFQSALSGILADLNFAFTGEDPTLSMPGILAVGLTYFTAFPAQIGAALKPTAKYVWDSFANPTLKILNLVLDGFRSTIRNLYDAFAQFMGDIARTMTGVSTATGGLFSPTVGQALLQGVQQLLQNKANFTIAPIVIKPPDFVGAASGGLFTGGVLRVGEHGEELIASAASRLSVFPAHVVRALDTIAAGYSAGVPYVSPALVQNDTRYDNSRHYGDFVVNGVQNPQGWRRQWNNIKAFS